MSGYNAKKIVNGSFGKLFINGNVAFDVKEASAVLSINREDVNMSGTNEIDTKISSTKGTGSFTVSKVYTRFLENLAAFQQGLEAPFELALEVNDPDNGGRESWQIVNAKIDGDIDIMNFSIDGLMEQAINFVFLPSNLISTSVITRRN